MEIVEVSPRDGLQNEPQLVSTADKIALIQRAVACGVKRIEVASFARPDRVPQMADAEAVIAGLELPSEIVTIGLVMNTKGALRALGTNVKELGAVCVASDSFAQRNQRQTSMESAQMAADVVRLAAAEGRRAQVTIGAAFGCPFEGEVAADHVLRLAETIARAEPMEIALADTIGVAVPSQVFDVVSRVRSVVGELPIRVHLHNTRNTGIANAWAAVEAGAATLDASLGGIGGCPFAPSATGNIATEDLLYMLDRSGIETGIDLHKTIEASHWLASVMNKDLPALVSRAGPFPRNQA
ncbi:MAG: hydroxymethylglutaryl-CoA lyase [Pseudomonadota bacterium]